MIESINKKINISIVIPSLNGENHLRDFSPTNLDIIKKTMKENNSYGFIEYIIINDNSGDRTLYFLESLSEKYKFLKFGTNPKQGAGSARNYGVSLSSIKRNSQDINYILFIDNDVLLDDNFFNSSEKYLKNQFFCITCNGINYFTKKKQDGVKLCTLKKGYLRFTKNIFNDQLKDINDTKIPSFGAQGAYFYVKFDDFIELNGYDEVMDPYLLEETDLVYRGLKRGKTCIYAPLATGYHKVGGTIASKTSKKTLILSKRNRNYFMWKNIHDKNIIIQHTIFLLLNILSPTGLRGFLDSLKMRKIAKDYNRKEFNNIKISDKEILRKSKNFQTYNT